MNPNYLNYACENSAKDGIYYKQFSRKISKGFEANKSDHYDIMIEKPEIKVPPFGERVPKEQMLTLNQLLLESFELLKNKLRKQNN